MLRILQTRMYRFLYTHMVGLFIFIVIYIYLFESLFMHQPSSSNSVISLRKVAVLNCTPIVLRIDATCVASTYPFLSLSNLMKKICNSSSEGCNWFCYLFIYLICFI